MLSFDNRSVFVAVVIQHLGRERDSGQQTLATWTFLRWHARRGVVIMVSVTVKVQGVKKKHAFCYRNLKCSLYELKGCRFF